MFKISFNNSVEVIHVYDLENLRIRCSNIYKFEASTTNESIEAFIMYDESVFLGENKIFYLSSQNTFEVSIIPAEFNSIRTLKIQDFNNDGLDDVVSCNGTLIKVFFQTQDFQFVNIHSIIFAVNQINDIELIDIDTDGDVDILFSNSIYPKLQAIINDDGFINYSISTIDSSFGSIREIRRIDFDEDNVFEFITSSKYYVDSRIVYYSNDQGVVTRVSDNVHVWDRNYRNVIKLYHTGGILNLNKIIDQFENAYIISIDGRMMTQISSESDSRFLQLKSGVYIIKIDTNEE
ncbi:MAG: VCBS repeat-containing protein [Bacteroidia bacterium]